jgi:hypothetical protein
MYQRISTTDHHVEVTVHPLTVQERRQGVMRVTVTYTPTCQMISIDAWRLVAFQEFLERMGELSSGETRRVLNVLLADFVESFPEVNGNPHVQ